MVIDFDKKTKKLVKKTRKLVAEMLEVDVDQCHLHIYTDCDRKHCVSLCFSTPIDDTYAELTVVDPSPSLVKVLKGFMENNNVEFMNRGEVLDVG